MKKLILTLSFVLLGYQLAFGVADDYYVTVAGGGGAPNNGTSWATAFTAAEFEADAEANAEAGDRYFVAGGVTFTVGTSIICGNDGTSAALIKIIGVKTGTANEPPVTTDWADGTDRPLFDFNDGFYMVFDNYWGIYNLRIDTDITTYGIRMDIGAILVNTWCNNSDVAADRAIYMYFDRGMILECEATCAAGTAIQISGVAPYGGRVIGCYAHDSVIGIDIDESYVNVEGCIADTCTTGIDLGALDYNSLENNTIYNCTTGIYTAAGSILNVFKNNIIDNCTDGFKANNGGTVQPTCHFDYNCWDNTQDMSWDNGASEDNTAKGANSVTADPDMGDPGGKDFTLNAGSPCLDTGMQMNTDKGTVGDYKWNIGADQDDNAAAGGGGGSSFFTIN